MSETTSEELGHLFLLLAICLSACTAVYSYCRHKAGRQAGAQRSWAVSDAADVQLPDRSIVDGHPDATPVTLRAESGITYLPSKRVTIPLTEEQAMRFLRYQQGLAVRWIFVLWFFIPQFANFLWTEHPLRRAQWMLALAAGIVIGVLVTRSERPPQYPTVRRGVVTVDHIDPRVAAEWPTRV